MYWNLCARKTDHISYAQQRTDVKSTRLWLAVKRNDIIHWHGVLTENLRARFGSLNHGSLLPFRATPSSVPKRRPVRCSSKQ